jgi:tRNA-Thr(GGU) m(6)t(6)A37 methyltransferase TsaA
MTSVTYEPIGVLRSPFLEPSDIPRQPAGPRSAPGRIELRPELAPGLQDLDGFSHILVLFHFHRSTDFSLLVNPPRDSVPHGVFATRSPRRPNPIGLSVLRLLRIEGNVLHVDDVDALDGTPVLDIKPYIPESDAWPEARAGWLEQAVPPAE